MTTVLKARTLEGEVAVLEAQARDLEAKLVNMGEDDVRHLSLVGSAGTELFARVASVLSVWKLEDRILGRKKPIHLMVNLLGHGGSILSPYVDVFAIMDFLRIMIKDGYEITMQVTGSAVNQGALLLQTEGVKRVLTPNSRLMFTEYQPQFHANSAEEDKMELHAGFEKHAQRLVAERTGHKVSEEQLAEVTGYGRQWWIDSDKALELGLADEVKVILASDQSYQPPVDLLPALEDSLQTRKQKARIRRDLAQAELLRMSAASSESAAAARDILFLGSVDAESCATAGAGLQRSARLSKAPLHMSVYSPGGSVVDGVTFLDVVQELKKTHEVETLTLGCAASMGGHLMQAASDGKRTMGKNSRIMMHRISRTFYGGAKQNKDQKAEMEKLEERVLPILIGRSTITTEEYMERTKKSDWWLDADEALKRKLVDEVI